MKAKAKIVVEFLNANLHDTLSLAAIANAVGLSRSRVGDLVKSATGMPPGLYIKTLRLEMAGKLLETTALEIKQVMLEVGVKDPSHFARDFKNRYGLTPSEYKTWRIVKEVTKGSSDETE